jgi:hypothetical protein
MRLPHICISASPSLDDELIEQAVHYIGERFT